jgi:phosphoribosylformylglycinamidine synthase
MKFGVVIFPGSNCDQDLIHVLQKLSAEKVEELWHKEKDLKGCTHIFLPGGFSYGDYLRSGALAKLSPVMEAVIQHADNGGFVMGICNGFQILCESGLLPGALLRNSGQNFICKNVFITTQNNQTPVTRNLQLNEPLKIPIAHAEGRFFADDNTLISLQQNKQIIFQYCDVNGSITAEENHNGSMENIAGIANKNFNVFGMMPHPERAADAILGNTDGLKILESILEIHTQTLSV